MTTAVRTMSRSGLFSSCPNCGTPLALADDDKYFVHLCLYCRFTSSKAKQGGVALAPHRRPEEATT